MRVHFIDTSVFTNILNVPNRNQQMEQIMKEFREIATSDRDLLILPFATIIETGNHIAQNGDGQQRRSIANKFKDVLLRTVRNEAPWQYYGKQFAKEDIEAICESFPDYDMRGEGFGDASIIRAYECYKNEVPGIEEIRIWSLDTHLSSYRERISPIPRRN